MNTQTAWLSYSRDAQTRRVTGVNLSAQAAVPQLDNTTYTYDAAGNITRSVNTQGGGTGAPTQTQCNTYDRLDQLTQAWSATDNCATTQTRPAEQVSKVVITQQPITMLGQQPIHAARHQLITQQQRTVIEACLPIRQPNSHKPDPR